MSNLLRNVCRYFRDFLDTDFKRQQRPKRQIHVRDREGNLASVALRKYPGFTAKVWEALVEPARGGLSLTFSRGVYQQGLGRALTNLIVQAVDAIPEGTAEAFATHCIDGARQAVTRHREAPLEAQALVLGTMTSQVKQDVVVPLLKKLESHFEQTSVRSLEDVFDIEEELADRLVGSATEQIEHAVNSALVHDDFDEFESLVRDLAAPARLRGLLHDYFQAFAAADLFDELLELQATLKVKDNFEIYLYIGGLYQDKTSYPLFYLPLSVKRTGNRYELSGNPLLYINKHAVDYLIQERAREEGHRTASPVEDRVIHLETDQTFRGVMQPLLDDFVEHLQVRPPINLDTGREQVAQSTRLRVTNALHLGAFEKSDESVLNDYEELLELAEAEGGAFMDFAEVVTGFLENDPVSVWQEVDDDWLRQPLEERLVYTSPVPLNEEQRKILAALNKPDCRFVAVQGPPGTGKSHTITAIAFDAILKQRNVLVLSDKTEALDVVESKLTDTLAKVRGGEQFQNPLLRLGKDHNTYSRIFSGQSIERLKRQYQVARTKEAELEDEIRGQAARLMDGLRTAAARAEAIDLQEVVAFERAEQEIEAIAPELVARIDDPAFGRGVDAIRALRDAWAEQAEDALALLTEGPRSPALRDLQRLVSAGAVIRELKGWPSFRSAPLKHFRSFNDRQIDVLAGLIRRYDDLKMPLFGFLFRRRAVRELDAEAACDLDLVNPLDPHQRLDELRQAYASLNELSALLARGYDKVDFRLVFRMLVGARSVALVGDSEEIRSLGPAEAALKDVPELGTTLDIRADNVDEWLYDAGTAASERLERLLDYQAAHAALTTRFQAIPEVDYTGDKARLEQLHARKLANTIDARVVQFHEAHRTKARTIRDIIKSKQRFPKEDFEHLKQAFPCIIANIRDYAEYVPLEPGLFDLVVIDEASQVSLAQAFPAIVRAKRLVVLGDRHQFSNVKTAQAANELNNQHLYTLREAFQRDKQGAAGVETMKRVEKIDIKTSVLDFVEMIANYGTMLRKHFRGYPELISFSSKYFYGNELQAVKLRGKPIDEVLVFSALESDGMVSLQGNVNEQEGDFIEGELERLLELEVPPTVAVITPFTDQQRYLAHRFGRHELGVELSDVLRLKVMTFDSCQGEEREVVFYSMVANGAVDKLNRIFPREVDSDQVEENLRQQRLNVGFSRAKERIQFVLSKPLDAYQNAIGQALRHYRREYELSKALPTHKAVDPSSPMEAKVLQWLRASAFYDRYGEQLEMVPQFPIGDYLRQLDQEYHAPAYRVDFLLKLASAHGTHNIIIEYDGFKEHFTDLSQVDAVNYRQYYRAADIEREKVLESYGYHMLRINRFNLGKDPVKTLSERLQRLVETFGNITPPEVISDMNELNQGLEDGDMRTCPKCGEVKPDTDFDDPTTVSGRRRHCKACRARR